VIKYCEGCFQKQLKIEQLQEEIKQLKAKLRYQERNQQEGYFGISTPSSKAPFKVNADEESKNRQGGGRPGHVGHGRKSHNEGIADKVIEIEGQQMCPFCGDKLDFKEIRKRTVIESEPVKPKRLLYKMHHKVCRRCGKIVRPRLTNVLPKSLYGNQLTSQATVMHYFHGVPMGRITEMLDINMGSLVNLFHRLSGYFAPAMETLKEQYRKSQVRHADETGWRVDGQNSYVWLFCTEKISLFYFERTRSASVPRKVFGEKKLHGVLVVDRYNAYNKIMVHIRYCYAHLLRDVEGLEKEFSDNQEVKAFVSVLAPLLSEAMHLRNQPISDKQYYRKAKEIQRKIIETSRSPAQHLGIRAIQDIFNSNEHRLYHWVKNRDVPPDNNRAERDLRPTVIARKVSFGTSSDAGSKTRSVLMSVLHTLNKCRGDQTLESVFKGILDKLAINPKADVASLLTRILSPPHN
jgi:transposase